MNTLDRYLLKQLIPVFVLTLSGLAFILSIAEMFTYIHLITDRQMPLTDMFLLLVLYLPQAVVYALPVSLLFSICLILASLYANNELIAILNSGVSFWRLTRTIIIAGLLLSIFSLVFQDLVQVPAAADRSSRVDALIGRPVSLDNRNIALWDRSGTTLYYSARYSERHLLISDITILVFDGRVPRQRIDARTGEYQVDSSLWKLSDVRVFNLKDDHADITYHRVYEDPRFNEPPEHFRSHVSRVEHMKIAEALAYIQRMAFIDAQVMREAMTNLYERIIFSFTPLIVTILSVSVGSRLKKNILLMSLFFSLGISVVYYIYEFIFLILSRQGYIHPLLGSLLPFTTFFILSVVLYRHAKT